MQITTTDTWSTGKKILFRFFFSYFSLFIIIDNNGAYPFWALLMQSPIEWLHMFVPWVGEHVLHLSYPITVFTNGSGDTTYDYVVIFSILCVAIVSTILWSILDGKRTNYQALYYWLTVAIRFYIALMLISYGLVKVIKLQFPAPGVFRLTEPFGNSSPMGLAWTFLGFSRGYNLFMGLAEVAAILLLFRRTMTFGAIITLMTTANVMAVNYFYDVPVKILSTHLALMTLFLLMYNANALWKFFFSGQAISLSVIASPDFSKGWMRWSRISFKVLIVGFLINNLIGAIQASKEYGDNVPPSKLNGIYNTETFSINQQIRPPLTTDTLRWKKLIIDLGMQSYVEMMNDSTRTYHLKVDTTWHSIQLTNLKDRYTRFDLSYQIPDPEHLLLVGTLKTDSVTILLKKTQKAPSDFPLMNRGFHWINEYPYNR